MDSLSPLISPASNSPPSVPSDLLEIHLIGGLKEIYRTSLVERKILDQEILAMMPDIEEHLSVHRVSEAAVGVGCGGECGVGQYSPLSLFLGGPALFFWVGVCGFSFVKDVFIQKASKLSLLSKELTV